ncbi:MAG TPA: hypothetical protein VGJ26_08605 [Pirellulales bacterium]|jgi:hypothetical protein
MSLPAIFCKACGLVLLLCVFASADDRWENHLTEHDRKVAWPVFRNAILDFQKNGDRAALLKSCKELLANDPQTGYAEPLRGLIDPLEREAAAETPDFLKVPPEKRTPEENIRYWIYQLRSVGGLPFLDEGTAQIFSFGGPPTAADQFLEIGAPAIPYLLDALDDDTPTQIVAWQRQHYPIYFLLRRQDIAMKCLERITACRFYDEGATFIHLYMDTPERRKSAIDNARKWWQESRGKTQAQGIRNQLRLRQQNITLRGYDRIAALRLLATLEGPEGILDELHALSIRDAYGLNSPIREALEQFDRPFMVQEALRRFWDHAVREGDYQILYKYGDSKVYQEMAKRFEESHKLDPSAWVIGDQAIAAARYGKNWSIPILAQLLTLTEMTGSRYVSPKVQSQPFCPADKAAELFQQVTGYNAGYDAEGSKEERLAAIEKAHRWWLDKGPAAMAAKTNEDHAPVVPIGDLLMTDEEGAALQALLNGTDAAARRKAIANLTTVYAPKTERALVSSLAKEDDPAERRRILEVLDRAPQPWYVPTMATVFANDQDEPSRLLAGKMLLAQFQSARSHGSPRLETRRQAFQEVRRVVADTNTPPAVRDLGTEMLKDRGIQAK